MFRSWDHAQVQEHANPTPLLLGSVSQVLDGQARAHVAHADALDFLRSLPPASCDILVTDPPYSSGGMVRGDRAGTGAAEVSKYSNRTERGAEIHGDTRDARSFAFWCGMWLTYARRALKPGAFVLVFTDWRQLPTMTDAVQAGGLVWRGVSVWNKGNAMPNKGRFRQDCEFVVVATNGPRACGPKVADPCWPGCYEVPEECSDDDNGLDPGEHPLGGLSYVPDPPAYVRASVAKAERHAVCSKPVALMEALLGPCPVGGVVLDPFVGWGATPVATLRSGRRFLGCEISEVNRATALARLEGAEVKVAS